jgi:ABC-type transporter Mla subunit MlaD
MRLLTSRLLRIALALCFFTAAFTAIAGPESASPNLLAAMKSLEAAKTADDPLPDLQDAIKSLDKATNNAGGKKDMAEALVNEAVQFAKDGDKDQMTQKIDHAIVELHEGMDRGGRRRD